MSSSTETTKTQSAGSTTSKSSGTLTKVIALLVIVMAIGGGLVFWKVKFGGHGSLNKITKAEMEALLKDANPMILKQMADPAMREKNLEGLKELLAVASEAQREFGSDTTVQRAFEFVDSMTLAQLYDKALHKDSGPMPAFGFITEDQVKAYWGEGQAEGSAISSRDAEFRKNLFEQTIEAQIGLAKKAGRIPEDQEIPEEQKQTFRNEFAKIKIYEEEAKAKIKEDPAKWGDLEARASIESKLQKAQILASLFQKTLAEKAKVSDADVDKYIAEHPELVNDAEKKAKAEDVIKRLNNGEDFAALAKELSEDPGSKENGGLYENRVQGAGFDPEFENAALGLEAGKFTTTPVKTQFGYHVIKLEKKGETKDASGQVKATYDVRHILFSTMVKDPENPMGREMPVKDFVKAKLQDDKEKEILEEVKKNNPIVIEDFEVPEVSDAQIQEMLKRQQQQQQMSPHSGDDEELPPTSAQGAKPDAKAPNAKPGAPKSDKAAPKSAPKK